MQGVQNNFFFFFNDLALAKANDNEQLNTVFNDALPQRFFNPPENIESLPKEVRELQAKLAEKDEKLQKELGGQIPLPDHEKGMDSLPTELQAMVLAEADTPSIYAAIRVLSADSAVTQHTLDKAVNQHAIETLKNFGMYGYADRIKMRLAHMSAEEYLLRHLFQVVRSECTPQELTRLAETSDREYQTAGQAAVTTTQSTLAKVLKVVSAILSNPIVRLAIGIAAAVGAWYAVHAIIVFTKSSIIPFVAHKIMQVAPQVLVRLGNVLASIYESLSKWVITMILGTFALRLLIGNSIITRIMSTVIDILLIPAKIALLPFNLAYGAWQQSRAASTELGRLTEVGGDQIYAARIQASLSRAEDMWVQQMMARPQQA